MAYTDTVIRVVVGPGRYDAAVTTEAADRVETSGARR